MLTQICLLTLPFLITPSLAQYSYAAAATSSAGMDMSAMTATTSASSSSTTGTTHDVDVGKGGLVFSPDSLTASMGDTIMFHFYPKNHSVVQSSFDSPCVPLSSGNTPAIYSGFMPVSGDEGKMMFTMMVNSTDPIWLYCSQGEHCQAGMGMVINQASSGPNTLDAYKAASKGVQAAASPDTGVSGGMVVANMESGSSMSSGTVSSSVSSARTSGASSAASTATSSATPSAASTGVATGLARPFAGAVAVGMLAVGLGVWTLL
jgi:plastocyanin